MRQLTAIFKRIAAGGLVVLGFLAFSGSALASTTAGEDDASTVNADAISTVAVQAEVLAFLDGVMQTLMRGDLGGFLSNFDAGFSSPFNGEDLFSVEDIYKTLLSYGDFVKADLDIASIEVNTTGDEAVVRGIIGMHYRPRNILLKAVIGAWRGSGEFTLPAELAGNLLKKVDGRWKIYLNSYGARLTELQDALANAAQDAKDAARATLDNIAAWLQMTSIAYGDVVITNFALPESASGVALFVINGDTATQIDIRGAVKNLSAGLHAIAWKPGELTGQIKLRLVPLDGGMTGLEEDLDLAALPQAEEAAVLVSDIVDGSGVPGAMILSGGLQALFTNPDGFAFLDLASARVLALKNFSFNPDALDCPLPVGSNMAFEANAIVSALLDGAFLDLPIDAYNVLPADLLATAQGVIANAEEGKLYQVLSLNAEGLPQVGALRAKLGDVALVGAGETFSVTVGAGAAALLALELSVDAEENTVAITGYGLLSLDAAAGQIAEVSIEIEREVAPFANPGALKLPGLASVDLLPADLAAAGYRLADMSPTIPDAVTSPALLPIDLDADSLAPEALVLLTSRLSYSDDALLALDVGNYFFAGDEEIIPPAIPEELGLLRGEPSLAAFLLP